ncbi:MAG: DUF3347 domain-containing protein [Gracilimonas sp.]|uniref:DUF3347 domain-containing protein n=1 Tax=Gracilimonas sp. TaxID=1974203 RepID=UPI001987735D|nr:DUF3347 domain-containing protein [Gracilimonas sp.]MBD3617273.1 DUF3347 domain-containing protein [Gracilimonas sp.]
MKSILTLTLLSLISFTAIAQHEDHANHQQEQHQHADHLETLILHYLEAKNALVHDNFVSAKEHLQKFLEEVHSSGEMNEHKEHAEKHADHHSEMLAAVQEAFDSEDIKALRSAFKKISGELITAVQNQGYEGKLFKQYCPMFEGGSSWLSTEEEVENPFFGQAMHSCGDSSELINKDSDES